MQPSSDITDHDHYAKCIEVSKRVRWDIDKDVIRGREFDFSQKFLPDGISQINRFDFLTAEEKKLLEEIDNVITAMSRDGIQMEICLFAANFFGVDPASISPLISRVDNGWISSMGYQAKGYSLIPAF